MHNPKYQFSIAGWENSTETGYFFDAGKAIQAKHLKVKHGKEVLPYLQRIPRLESLEFDYSPTAFRKSFDYLGQMTAALENCQISSFHITSSKFLETLPEALGQQKLKRLRILNCPNLKNLEPILKAQPELEELVLGGWKAEFSGKVFPYLKKLKKLSISAESFESFEGLGDCNELHTLTLNGLKNETLPKNIQQLKSLECFHLIQMPNLETIPNLDHCQNLHEINFRFLPSVKSFSINFDNKKQLEKLQLHNIGQEGSKQKLSDSLSKCENLKWLELTKLQIEKLPLSSESCELLVEFNVFSLPRLTEIPDVFDWCQHLKAFNAHDLPLVTKLPKSIGTLQKMERLSLREINVKNFDLDLTFCTGLIHLSIIGFSELEQIDATIANLPNLKSGTFIDLPKLQKLPPFGEKNWSLENLRFEKMPSVQSFPKSIFKCPSLHSLQMDYVNFEEIPEGFSKLKKLYSLKFQFCEKLKMLPLDILNAPALQSFSVHGSQFLENKALPTTHKFFVNAKKSLPEELRPYLFYCMINGFDHAPLTDEIKTGILRCLTSRATSTRLIILSQLYKMNSGQQPFSANQIKKGDKVFILGKTDSAVTPIKSKLKDLGLTPVKKISADVRFVLVGKSPKLEANFFESERILFSENELETISKEINPKLLQQEETPKEYIENLRQLLWSGDASNQAVALELVKNNGMPDIAQDDFLYVSKTCKDKNVKSRIRKFLKGKVSEDRERMISTGGSNFKIQKFIYKLSPEVLANLYFSEFKTTGKTDHSFFQYAEESHPGRQEFFEKYMNNVLLEKPHYIQTYANLSVEELNLLFENPTLDGKLKKVILHQSVKGFPSNLLRHADTLTTLTINFDNSVSVLPKELYGLKKLSRLRFEIRESAQLPEGFSNLKRLLHLNFYAPKGITFPADFLKMKQLKTFGYQGVIDNLEDFLGKMEHINI